CIAWSLGWCNENSNDKDLITTLRKLYEGNQTSDFVSGIAFEAVLKICDDEKKAELKAKTIEFLPSHFQKVLKNGSSEKFTTELIDYLKSCDYQGYEIIEIIYEIDN
ncbi:MAG: hypothetical protein MJK14_11395, partial [Rivularia sp. ALOHA_DT_140]|nr:hypothetical protein [Rivularia sp. ALOHA_DT_140]